MKMKKVALLILSIATLIFELLPYGVVLNFANPWRAVAQDIFLFQSDTIRICELRSVDYCHTDLRFTCSGGCLPLQVT